MVIICCVVCWGKFLRVYGSVFGRGFVVIV